jgi:phage terminase large subunit
MWRQMKDWLAKGAIPDEEQLALQICLPGYHINRSNKLVLESKSDLAQRGEASPDDADALALTSAQHVAPIEAQQQEPVLVDIFVGDGFSGLGGGGWMG